MIRSRGRSGVNSAPTEKKHPKIDIAVTGKQGGVEHQLQHDGCRERYTSKICIGFAGERTGVFTAGRAKGLLGDLHSKAQSLNLCTCGETFGERPRTAADCGRRLLLSDQVLLLVVIVTVL
jgi:hypothetical protein